MTSTFTAVHYGEFDFGTFQKEFQVQASIMLGFFNLSAQSSCWDQFLNGPPTVTTSRLALVLFAPALATYTHTACCNLALLMFCRIAIARSSQLAYFAFAFFDYPVSRLSLICSVLPLDRLILPACHPIPLSAGHRSSSSSAPG